jgi:hypothetical protein
MAEPKTCIIPSPKELMKKLQDCSTGIKYFEKKFNPILLRHSGQEVNGLGAINLFLFAVNDYITSTPKTPMQAAVESQFFDKQMNCYIGALIGHCPDVMNDATKFFDEDQ